MDIGEAQYDQYSDNNEYALHIPANLELTKYDLTVNDGSNRTDVLDFLHWHAEIVSIQDQHVSE